MQKSAAKDLSPTPNLIDGESVRIENETAGKNSHRSSHSSSDGSHQNSDSARGQDVMMIEHLESSFSETKERSIAIEKLSRNSEGRKSSPSASSVSKSSKANGSIEKIDP